MFLRVSHLSRVTAVEVLDLLEPCIELGKLIGATQSRHLRSVC